MNTEHKIPPINGFRATFLELQTSLLSNEIGAASIDLYYDDNEAVGNQETDEQEPNIQEVFLKLIIQDAQQRENFLKLVIEAGIEEGHINDIPKIIQIQNPESKVSALIDSEVYKSTHIVIEGVSADNLTTKCDAIKQFLEIIQKVADNINKKPEAVQVIGAKSTKPLEKEVSQSH